MPSKRTAKKLVEDSKRRQIVLQSADFRIYLMVKVETSMQSGAEFARSLGISADLLYLLMAGKRKPSAAVLSKLNLEVCYQFVEKPKRKS